MRTLSLSSRSACWQVLLPLAVPRDLSSTTNSAIRCPHLHSNQINVSVLVRTFDSSVFYKDNRIVYATSPQELGLYEGQRWINPPVEMLQDSILRGLRASGHYRSVMSVRGEGGGEVSLRVAVCMSFANSTVVRKSLPGSITLSVSENERPD